MKQPYRVNPANTTNEELARLAEACGFIVKHGGHHDKIKTREGKFVTMIPRHGKIKRETARSIVEALNTFGAGIEVSK